MSRNARDEREYELSTLAKGLRVLAALEGTSFEHISIARIQQRTGFTYDFCRSALITLKLAGFAAEVNGKWTAGPKVIRFGTNFNEVCIEYGRRSDSTTVESGGG
jgi:DNA-binding IclR family transcriptional regulator